MNVELILSPLGLMVRVWGQPTSAVLAMEEVVFEFAMLGSKTIGLGAFDFYHFLIANHFKIDTLSVKGIGQFLDCCF